MQAWLSACARARAPPYAAQAWRDEWAEGLRAVGVKVGAAGPAAFPLLPSPPLPPPTRQLRHSCSCLGVLLAENVKAHP